MSVSVHHAPDGSGMKSIILRVLGGIFLLIGIIALGYTGFVAEESRNFQRTASRALENTSFHPAPKESAALIKPGLRDGSLIGHLEIPRLGIDVVVAEGDSNDVLRRAVGHIPDTPLPGEPGNIALAGHRDTFFRPLRKIQPGDVITIDTSANRFQYEVQSTNIVSPSDMSVLKPTADSELTLVTCFPFYYVGAAPKRFIVRARNRDAVEAVGQSAAFLVPH